MTNVSTNDEPNTDPDAEVWSIDGISPPPAGGTYRDPEHCPAYKGRIVLATSRGTMKSIPPTCKGWDCLGHCEDKREHYCRSFRRSFLNGPAPVATVFVGFLNTSGMTADERTKALGNISDRASDRGGVAYVHVRSGRSREPRESHEYWFAEADLSLKIDRSGSVVPKFTEVPDDLAEALFAELLKRPMVRVGGSRTTERRWMPPDRYSREPAKQGHRPKHQSLGYLEDGELEESFRRAVSSRALDLVDPNAFLKDKQRHWIVEDNLFPTGQTLFSPREFQAALVEVATELKADVNDLFDEAADEEADPRRAWQTWKPRVIEGGKNDEPDEQDDNERNTA